MRGAFLVAFLLDRGYKGFFAENNSEVILYANLFGF